jgi:hypothetical protein
MSIVRQLIQICMVEAFRGRTVAGDNVLDSNITAIGRLEFEGEAPVIAASVEESDQNEKNSRGFFGRPAELKLYVQTAVAVKGTYLVVTGDGPDQEQELVEIGSTDAAREATLNILERQWKQALIDPANAWGNRFLQLVTDIGRVQDTRITDPEGGRKYAARVYEISGTAIPEPDFGQALPEDVDAILTAVGDLEDYADLEKIWRDLFAKAATPDERVTMQASAALSGPAFAALGLNVIEPEGEDLDGVVVAIEDLDAVVTPGDADDQVPPGEEV